MTLKLSVLNNVNNNKIRTRKMVVSIASPKSFLPKPSRGFSIFFISKNVIRSGDPTSINPVFTLKMVAYYRKTNNKLSKDTTRKKFCLSFM